MFVFDTSGSSLADVVSLMSKSLKCGFVYLILIMIHCDGFWLACMSSGAFFFFFAFFKNSFLWQCSY